MIPQYPPPPASSPANDSSVGVAMWPQQSGIHASLNGDDPHRLERLVREHGKLLWRIAQRLGADSTEAEDIAQRVFLVAIARLDELVEGKERAFLVKTAIFMTRRALRVRSRRADELAEDSPALVVDIANADEQLDRQRTIVLLDRMLRKLPTKLREVFVLFELEGHSQPEIAEQLGIPLGTVASRLKRGRERFLRLCAKHKITAGALP